MTMLKKESIERMAKTDLYKKNFVKKMKEAEGDLEKGNTKSYSTKEFLKSLS